MESSIPLIDIELQMWFVVLMKIIKMKALDFNEMALYRIMTHSR